METILHWLWGWRASPWAAPGRSTSADEVLYRTPDAADAVLRGTAPSADEVLYRTPDAADDPLRAYA